MKSSTWSWTLEEQLEKNNRLKLSDINELEAWMRGEQYLPKIPDQQLVLFHHACEYNIDKTKETIEKCYTMRTTVKEFFSNRDPLHKYLQETTKVAMCTPLAGYDKEGNQVIWMKLLDTDPQKYYYGVQTKYIFMVMDAIQVECGPVPGYIFVIDGKGYTLSHMLRTSLNLCKKFIAYSQDASTFFPKAIYVLNVSSILEKALSVVKPFMKSELFKIITFFKSGKYDGLLEKIPEDILPNEYGGKGGTTQEIQDRYLKKLVTYADWFKEEEKLRIDETKIKGDKGSSTKKISDKESEEDLTLRSLAID